MIITFLTFLTILFWVNTKVTQWGAAMDSNRLYAPRYFLTHQHIYYYVVYLLVLVPLIIAFFFDSTISVTFALLGVVVSWYVSAHVGLVKAFYEFRGGLRKLEEYEEENIVEDGVTESYFLKSDKMTFKEFIQLCKRNNRLERRTQA